MPDTEMEARHVVQFERIRHQLLDHRAFWRERLNSRPDATRMIAILDVQLAINASLLCLAEEGTVRARNAGVNFKVEIFPPCGDCAREEHSPLQLFVEVTPRDPDA